MVSKLKYQNQIECLADQGICCPPNDNFSPNDLTAYRYVFDNQNHIRNHKPPGAINPRRVLTEKDTKRCTLFGLSCFETKEGAISFFRWMKESVPNFELIVGDTISTGIIDENDGLVTIPELHTHFDLFEFEHCDLSQKFIPIEKII